jgi:hypothetical protein
MVPPATVTLAVAGSLGRGAPGCALRAVQATTSSAVERTAHSER